MQHPLNGIFLRDGAITVGIAPDCGGALTRFDVRTRDSVVNVLRPATARHPANRCSLGSSCFPLVPYGGRLRQGRFEFEGRSHQFPLNALPERHSSHGDGWTRPWTLRHLERRRAVMSFEADESVPLQYRCDQSVSIAGDCVSIQLSAHNLSAHRIPVGFGLHPYFADRGHAIIKAEVPAQWRWDQEMMPVSIEGNPDAERFRRGQPVSELPITAEYADWSGRAVIDWPKTQLRVDLKTSPPLSHVVMWMPTGEDFFCFEPVSHATDALNRQAAQRQAGDFRIVEPNATAEQRFDFFVSCPDS